MKEDFKNKFLIEDNAISRRTWDLSNAGLSPTLAAGSAAGTGGVVNSSAPQWDTDAPSKALQAYSLIKMQQDISQGQQNIESQKIQNRKTLAEIGMMPTIEENMKAQTINLGATAWRTSTEAKAKSLDLNIQKETGGTSQPDTVTNFIRNSAGAISKAFGTHPNQVDNAKGQIIKKVETPSKTPKPKNSQQNIPSYFD